MTYEVFTFQLLQMFYRQQEEIRRLREMLIQRDIQIKQLQLEIKNRHVDSRRFWQAIIWRLRTDAARNHYILEIID